MWLLLFMLFTQKEEPIPNEPPRFYVCLHWAHPDGIEWTTTVVSGEDHWEYLREKYPGSYKGKCRGEE